MEDEDEDEDEAERALWHAASKAGWRGRLPARDLRQRLPSELPFGDLDFEGNDPRFADLDGVVKRLIARRKLPERWQVGQLWSRAIDTVSPANLRLFDEVGLWYGQYLRGETPADVNSIFALRRLVARAATAAVNGANYFLVDQFTSIADAHRARERMRNLVDDLSYFERFSPLIILDFMPPPSEFEKFHQPIRRLWGDEGREFNALQGRLDLARAAAAIARREISELAASLTIPADRRSPGDDVLAREFIGSMRELWRLFCAQEPGRGVTGPFVDLVVAGWRVSGLSPLRARKGKQWNRRQNDVDSTASWLGKRIAIQARRENWPFSRRKI